jgi:hypothetical protein
MIGMTRLAPVLGLALLVSVAGASTTDAEEAKAPRIAVDPAAFDFGKALQNKTPPKDFVLRNLGATDLEISRVSTTCGCTAALAASTVIKPGASTTLSVDLQTRTYTGKVERRILIESNDAKSPLELKVQATVVAAP